MTILGNIFLALATLIYGLIVSAAYGARPPQSGDAVAGYPMGMILFHLVFLGCMAVVAIAIGWKGGFGWAANSKRSQLLLVALGLSTITLVAALSALFKFDGRPPFSIRYLTGIAPALFPLVLLIAAAILLNAPLRAIVPVVVYKTSLMAVLVVSLIACLAGLVAWIIEEQQSAASQAEGALSDQERYHQDRMAELDITDPMTSDGLINMLVFTDGNHRAELREKALEKIKSNPEWQQVLVTALKSESAPQVFTFLASNEVEDKALFAEPVREGILQLATSIRSSIRRSSHPSHFYEDQFSWEIERMLKTVEKFKAAGVDYLPAIKEVRAALDEPSDPPGLKQVKFKVVGAMDRWIKGQ